MLLNVKAAAITGAILAGGTFFLVALGNLVFSSYGVAFLDLGASLYPGYKGPGGFGSVVVVTMYALVDGFIAGAILSWLYNKAAKSSSEHVKM